MSQIHPGVQSEFLVAFMGIFAEIFKHHHQQQLPSKPTSSLTSIDEELLLELLRKLRENSYLEKDAELLRIYIDLFVRLPTDASLNSSF